MEKFKFKVISGHVEEPEWTRGLEEKVNHFLENHDVIEVKTNFDSNSYQNWLACGMTQVLVYTIKYKVE